MCLSRASLYVPLTVCTLNIQWRTYVLAHLASWTSSALFYLYKCVIKFKKIILDKGNIQINLVSINSLLKLNF